MTRYKKTCNRGCGQEIEMSDETGNGWLPFNLDGSAHVCQETKARNRIAQGDKNNHGNEDYGELKDLKIIKDIDQKRAEYVDHTQGIKEKLKLKVLTDPTPDGLALLYNNFAETHNIKYSQYQPVNALYTIAVYFEEIGPKQ